MCQDAEACFDFFLFFILALQCSIVNTALSQLVFKEVGVSLKCCVLVFMGKSLGFRYVAQ